MSNIFFNNSYCFYNVLDASLYQVHPIGMNAQDQSGSTYTCYFYCIIDSN